LLSALETVYIGVISAFVLGILYLIFVEVFNSGFRLKISGVERVGRKKEKKKTSTSKAKTKNS